MTIHTGLVAESPKVHSGLKGVIQRHPLIAFFTLANLLSWLAWIPYILSENGLGVLHFSFPQLLGTSQLAGVLPGAYLGPIFSAYLVTRITDGKSGVRQWAGRLKRFRVRWYWYVTVPLAVPAVLTVSAMALTDQSPAALPASVLIAYVPMLLLQMVTTGLAEEPGWRDFALPRLQRRFGPLGGTLILGPLWGIWHLPLFLSEWGGWPHVTPMMPVVFVATCVTFSIVMTWVFNRTGESLPLAMLLHTSVNTFSSIALGTLFPNLPTADFSTSFLLGSTAVALVLLIATRGRLGYRRPELANN